MPLYDRYWICDSCAAKAKAVEKFPTGGNTVKKGTCGYCGAQLVILTPIVDFTWPEGMPKLKNEKKE